MHRAYCDRHPLQRLLLHIYLCLIPFCIRRIRKKPSSLVLCGRLHIEIEVFNSIIQVLCLSWFTIDIRHSARLLQQSIAPDRDTGGGTVRCLFMDVVFQLAAAAAFTVRRHKRVGLGRCGVKTDFVSAVVVAAAIASRLGTHTAHT